ncbi:MAG: glycosyltransferase family 2 protein [Myxacorys californica WJT36-NPBG1]|jgi:glycosyltransferase involved in cell wall biosynthesis|nr:glycosyltransferase family 2 protein [Myxacorys californica WJT36-NPBG1]
MKPAISVITCTHNPRRHYLDRVLNALKDQTLSTEHWELLIIDNASDRSLNAEIDLSWHPKARCLREEQLGLTPARLRGIREAEAEILIFVDDDNVLNSDYLEIALQISKNFPFVGAWGGQTQGEFEVPPPDWAQPYLILLAIREFDHNKWSNLYSYETTPCGAGLCVRKLVAEKYAELVFHHPKRLELDRKGQRLTSGGDSDLAFTAHDLNLGTGLFPALKLTHLIPAQRLQESYFLKLIEGVHYSNAVLDFLRGDPNWSAMSSNSSLRGKLRQFYHLFKRYSREHRFYEASQRGKLLAVQEITEFLDNLSSTPPLSH